MPAPDRQMAAHIAIRIPFRIELRLTPFSHTNVHALVADHWIHGMTFGTADGMCTVLSIDVLRASDDGDIQTEKTFQNLLLD
jgi:hypothetical protein